MASGAFASAGLVRQGRGHLFFEINISQLLPIGVAHDEGRTLNVSANVLD
jgi:hypothetical protein